MKIIDLKEGFRRVFVGVAVIWALLVLGYFAWWLLTYNYRENITFGWVLANLVIIIAAIVIPLAVLYLIGKGIAWIAEGFVGKRIKE